MDPPNSSKPSWLDVLRSMWDAGRALYQTAYLAIKAILMPYFKHVPRTHTDQLLQTWARGVLRDIDARIQISGLDELQRAQAHQRPVILMSNHTSLYDIPIVYATIPGSIRMIGKQELFRIPFFGRAVLKHEFIPINRRHRDKAIKQLAYAKEKLQSGITLWAAPEGTRSRDGHLLDFRKGIFMLALDTDSLIVPVAIQGAHHILPAKSSYIRRHVPIHVRVGPAIDTRDYTTATKESLIAKTRDTLTFLLS